MFVEVASNDEFDYYQSQVQLILSDAIPIYSGLSWARKVFSNGAGGYYVPVPSGLRDVEGIEELIANYPQYPTLPSVNPPNTFTPITVTDSVVYSTANISNLGELAKLATLTEVNIITRNNGDKLMLLTYRQGDVVILDLQDNSYHYYNSGFFKPWKPMYLTNQDAIVWVCATSPDLFKIDLTTYTTTYTTIPGVTITNSISGIQSRCIGTDGNIYFGASTDARIWRYNPNTDVITYLGQISSLANTYIYWIGADSDYTYSILRKSGNYWIGITNNTTFVTIYYYSDANLFKGGYISLYQSGVNKFWYLSLTTSATTSNFSVKLQNGVEVAYPLTTLLTSEFNGQVDYGNLPANFPSRYFIDYFDLDSAGIDGDSSIQYKITTDPLYTTASFSEVVKESQLIATMTSTTDGDIIGAFSSYYPVFKFDTGTDTVSQMHVLTTESVYALMDFDTDTYFIGGYANVTNKWLFNDTWDNGITNPTQIHISQSNAYYHYFYAKSGTYLYIAQEISRNDYGTAIAMYIPSTDTIIQADATQIALLKNYAISHVFTINNGDKLVMIGKAIASAIYPRIFVWDISSDKNINNLTPLSFDLNLTGLSGGYGVQTATDIFFAFCGNVVYKVDLTASPTVTLTYKNLPGTVQSSAYWARPIGQKSDGTVMFLCPSSTNTYLYELNPATFTAIRKSSNLGQNIYLRKLVITTADDMYFFSGDTSATMDGGVYSKYFIEKLAL